MLDGKKMGQEIWKALSKKVKEEIKTEELWEIVGQIICSHFKENAQVAPGIELQAGGKPGATTGIGKIQ